MLEAREINSKEIPLIADVEKNETWLLGEKVGHSVDPKCPEVQSKVVEIVLTAGAKWRIEMEMRGKKPAT